MRTTKGALVCAVILFGGLFLSYLAFSPTKKTVWKAFEAREAALVDTNGLEALDERFSRLDKMLAAIRVAKSEDAQNRVVRVQAMLKVVHDLVSFIKSGGQGGRAAISNIAMTAKSVFQPAGWLDVEHLVTSTLADIEAARGWGMYSSAFALLTKLDFFVGCAHTLFVHKSAKDGLHRQKIFTFPVDFNMYVYRSGDIVSWSVNTHNAWHKNGTFWILEKLEEVKAVRGVEKSYLMDLGANLGWFTILAAHHGFHTLSFEPLPSNNVATWRSLCEAPEAMGRVEYHTMGLGNETSRCTIFSDNQNVGDGWTQCGEHKDDEMMPGYAVRGEMSVHPLDTIIGEQYAGRVAVVKIDVEGFEPIVFKGGMRAFSAMKIPYLLTEFGVGRYNNLEYLLDLYNLGYTDVRLKGWSGRKIERANFESFVEGLINNNHEVVDFYMTHKDWAAERAASGWRPQH